MKRYLPAILVVAFFSFFVGVALVTWAMHQSITPCATMAEFGGIQKEAGSLQWEMVNGHMARCRVEKFLPR